ncbi:hypothetical protein GY45DRAFT_476845 [Cubamyces sp. BRFM 1775]|nr:hypothetical protein GY45DRAFT_476845 [Cubamyces sp. BRFM 1775]
MGYSVVFLPPHPPLSSSCVLSVSPGVWLPPPFGLPVPNLGLCDVYVLHSCSFSGPASRLRIPPIRFRSVSSNTIHDLAMHAFPPFLTLPPTHFHPLSIHILHCRLPILPLTNCYVSDPCCLSAIRRTPRALLSAYACHLPIPPARRLLPTVFGPPLLPRALAAVMIYCIIRDRLHSIVHAYKS